MSREAGAESGKREDKEEKTAKKEAPICRRYRADERRRGGKGRPWNPERIWKRGGGGQDPEESRRSPGIIVGARVGASSRRPPRQTRKEEGQPKKRAPREKERER